MDWLPTSVWAIEHQDGVIVVDTSQGALLETSKSLRPYVRWEVVFRIEHEEEIGLSCGPSELGRAM